MIFIRFNDLVGRDGFEPSKTKSTDLQSVAFGRSATFPYVLVDLQGLVIRHTPQVDKPKWPATQAS